MGNQMIRAHCCRKECVMRDAVMHICPLHAHEVYNNLGELAGKFCGPL